MVSSAHEWHIYLDKIPSREDGCFWVSFETDCRLAKTKYNIYNRCLPCIQNLYCQLKKGQTEITLGTAFNCWKLTVILNGLDGCLQFLYEFEKKFPGMHVWGKLGSGRPGAKTKVVVFHAESIEQRDRIRTALKTCLQDVEGRADVQISRGCAALYDDLLGDWRKWRPIMEVKSQELAKTTIEKIKKILHLAKM